MPRLMISLITFSGLERRSSGEEQRMNIDSSNAVNLIKMEVLPREILCIIFSYLDKKSVRNATATCALWFQLIRSDTNLSGYISLEKIGPEQLFEKILIGEWDSARWPVLKTLEFGGLPAANIQTTSSYLSKLVYFNDIPTLEKVVISVYCTITGIFPKFTIFPLKIIKELTFDPKIDVESVGIEHVSRLKLLVDPMYWCSKNTEHRAIQEQTWETAQNLNLLGETPHNLKNISITSRNVGCVHLDSWQVLKNSFEQLFKVLDDRLQSVHLIAGDIRCIDPLFSDSTPITEIWIEKLLISETRRYQLTGLFQKFKKLRKCRVDLAFDREPTFGTWPKFVEETFQDVADFKFTFVKKKHIRPTRNCYYRKLVTFEITRR